MAEKKYTRAEVLKAWSDLSGRKDQYDVKEFTDDRGVDVTQLIDKDSGSVTVQVDAQGDSAWQRLGENVGSNFIDGGTAPEDPKQEYTSRGVLETPTQPEALKENQGRGEVDPDNKRGNTGNGKE